MFDAATGEFSGTAPAGTATTLDIKVTASDLLGPRRRTSSRSRLPTRPKAAGFGTDKQKLQPLAALPDDSVKLGS